MANPEKPTSLPIFLPVSQCQHLLPKGGDKNGFFSQSLSMLKFTLSIPLTLALASCVEADPQSSHSQYELSSSASWCNMQSISQDFFGTHLLLDDGMYLLTTPETNTLLFIGDELNSSALATLTMESFEDDWLPQYKGLCSGATATAIVDTAIDLLANDKLETFPLAGTEVYTLSSKNISTAQWSTDVSFDTLTSSLPTAISGAFPIPDLDSEIGTKPCIASECPGGIIIRKWRLPRPPRPRADFEF